MTDTAKYVHDTIVAAATPPGAGGIGVVRLSGSRVAEIGTALLGELPTPRLASLKEFRAPDGSVLDHGIAIWFPAPKSFTGEAVLELQGHGGPVVVGVLVDAAVRLGARRAEPGEFSKRAFLNDKLDLAQTEAIADLVASGSEQAARAALRSLAGEFSAAVEALNARLLALRMHVEAAIDFPEEEIDFLSDEKLEARIRECGEAFVALRERATTGRVLRDGYRIVIVGRPNAGKSSLLNLLAGQDTAIVTEVAGTTRDVLREIVNIDGLMVELVDTAGLRDDPDRIEAEGIRRAREALVSADAVLWIRDASEPAAAVIDEQLPRGVPLIVVHNKIDLTGLCPGRIPGIPPVIAMSAKTGAGLDDLQSVVRELAGYRNFGEGAFSARQRHIEALDLGWSHFRAGRDALIDARAGELMAEELRLAQEALGTITGATSSDELLGRIFSEFCIGK